MLQGYPIFNSEGAGNCIATQARVEEMVACLCAYSLVGSTSSALPAGASWASPSSSSVQ